MKEHIGITKISNPNNCQHFINYFNSLQNSLNSNKQFVVTVNASRNTVFNTKNVSQNQPSIEVIRQIFQLTVYPFASSIRYTSLRQDNLLQELCYLYSQLGGSVNHFEFDIESIDALTLYNITTAFDNTNIVLNQRISKIRNLENTLSKIGKNLMFVIDGFNIILDSETYIISSNQLNRYIKTIKNYSPLIKICIESTFESDSIFATLSPLIERDKTISIKIDNEGHNTNKYNTELKIRKVFCLYLL